MAAHGALRVGPENGHTAAWGRRLGGEEGDADPQVPAEHISVDRSPSLWHAGRLGANNGPCVHGLYGQQPVSLA